MESSPSTGQIIGWTVGAIVGVVLLVVILNALSIVNVFWQADVAKITAPARVKQFRYGTGNAVTSIAYFHNQCNDVLGDEQNVKNATVTYNADQSNSRSTDPIKANQAQSLLSQDQTDLLGAKDQLSNDVRDYDAKSASSLSDPFKEQGLPTRITLNADGSLPASVTCG